MLQPAVLLVDDDPSTRHLIIFVLRREGYRILAARDATEALQVMANSRGSIALVLTDIGMPGLSGLELAKRISAAWPETKILFITAYAERFDAGLYPVLAKPFTSEQLLSRIQEVLS